MVGQLGLNGYAADFEGHLFEFADENVAGELVKFDREIGAFHLLGEHAGQALFSSFVAEKADLVLRIVGWLKKWKTLDVVPMSVRDEDREIERFAIEL